MPMDGSDRKIERIEITRAEFEHQFGLKPEPSSMGMLFCGVDGVPLYEYVFNDDVMIGEAVKEIEELERMLLL